MAGNGGNRGLTEVKGHKDSCIRVLLLGRVGCGCWDSKGETHTEKAGVRKP